MSTEELEDYHRSNGLPCDNVGRLYCWPCWDRLFPDFKGRFHFHMFGAAEHCDFCGMIAQPGLSKYPWKRRQD